MKYYLVAEELGGTWDSCNPDDWSEIRIEFDSEEELVDYLSGHIDMTFRVNRIYKEIDCKELQKFLERLK